MAGVDLDELLAARERVNAERARTRGRVDASAASLGVTEDLTLPRLIGLWLLVTGLIVLKVLAMLLTSLAQALEWIRREADERQATRRRRARRRH